ncbi:MAG: FtsK/SpoIIIE domain-containing protein [Candidatus Nanopelagicales bacterium]
MVNVAQGGRSLGLHLILATQRPSGVIKDNLRANTNLRIALRMADEADSTDILGSSDAAAFDASAPGRAAVKIGAARLVAFQSGYVGGHTPDVAPPAPIDIRELALAGGRAWERPVSEAEGLAAGPATSDLQRVVATIRSASEVAQVPTPRRPWLPELPSVIELADLETARLDSHLVFGLMDAPEDQSQPEVAFEPDRDGNLAVFGTGGSGKSTVLRSLAVAAGLAVRGGPVHVYGLDFGARGLQMLEPLPHVGSIVSGDDAERVARLMKFLRSEVDTRAARYASVQAANITEFRARSGEEGEPRIMLLLDGLAAFRQQYELGSAAGVFEQLAAIAADGRPVGIHVVLSADRGATVPSSLGSLVPRRLVLRAADDNDLALLGVPKDLFTLQSPPGRGFLDEREVQVAVLSGATSVAEQANAITRLAGAMERNARWEPAPAIRRLPTSVRLDELPVLTDEQVVIGLEDESLAPVGVASHGTFVVAGPPGSGRTTAVTSIVDAHRRARPELRVALFAPARSTLGGSRDWDIVVEDADEAATSAERLAAALATSTPGTWLVVIESPGDFLNGPADVPLQDLVKAARVSGQLVVAEGDTQSLGGSWGLVSAVRYSRRGIVLQPDQTDGDTLFRTPFPRVRRADFPQGRGLLVSEGRSARVQVALP